MTEITLEEAKGVMSNWYLEDDYIQENFKQFLDQDGEPDDNSIQLSQYWKDCQEIVEQDRIYQEAIASKLEQLKQKYPLAFDTIKLPVRYVKSARFIRDDNEQILFRMDYREVRTEEQDQIGELIAHLLNQLK